MVGTCQEPTFLAHQQSLASGKGGELGWYRDPGGVEVIDISSASN